MNLWTNLARAPQPRRGVEIGDYLVVTFDNELECAVATFGTTELIDVVLSELRAQGLGGA